MTKIFNRKSQKVVRQNLRNRPTYYEKIFWRYLRGSNLGGYKFRRQQGIGPYVVDFYCPEANLALEIDGDSHYQTGAAKYDKVRQQFIEKMGIKVVRFTDNDIRDNLDEVLEIVLQKLCTTPNPSSERRGNKKISPHF
jgi:very-short-patch-repair endonuclease